MFARVIKSKGKEYLNIIDGYRDEDGKVRQKVIANLGRIDELKISSIENLVQKLLEIVDSKKFLKDREVPNIEELDYFNINDNLNLNHIYRSLDILADNKELIEKLLFMQNKSLFNISTDIVFYDVTTFYFESKNENDLKKFGYSKDAKFGDVQVVMGLLIDKSGMPIGYELFSGNTFEGKTMVNILQKLKEKFNIDKVVIVADRGLNSKLNLKQIKDAGFDYIMASRVKKLPKDVRNQVLNVENYEKIYSDEDDFYAYKELNYENFVEYKEEIDGKIVKKSVILNEKLVCTFSENRAKKDRIDRERALQKANNLISNKQKSSITSFKSFKKFVKVEDKCKNFIMSLDWLKAQESTKFDGFYAITTSKLDLNPIEVIENYLNLYKIEDSFRVLKSTFNTRPIFHHKESRIEGHFVMSFIAFMLERDLEIRLKKSKLFQDEIISPERIKDALNSLEISKVAIDGKVFYMKSNHTNENNKLKFGRNILKFLHIKQLKNINLEEEILEILKF